MTDTPDINIEVTYKPAEYQHERWRLREQILLDRRWPGLLNRLLPDRKPVPARGAEVFIGTPSPWVAQVVWAAETGNDMLPNPVTTDDDGWIDVWLDNNVLLDIRHMGDRWEVFRPRSHRFLWSATEPRSVRFPIRADKEL